MINLRQLEHLLALDEERHFAHAAERVQLSQPAFSRSIQAAESEVGMLLFEREAGAIRPTPAGEFVIERARQLMFHARGLNNDIALYRDSALGDVAFGAGPIPAVTLVPDVTVALRLKHPEISFRIEINNWRLLLERLRSEDIEFFVADVREVPADAAIEVQSLGRQAGGFYVRQGHPLSAMKCSLAEVWAQGVVTSHYPEAIKAGFAERLKSPPGEFPKPAVQCDDVALLKALALRTDSVLALTEATVRCELDAGALQQLDVRDSPPIFAEMGLASLRNRTLSPAAREVIGLIKKGATALNQAAA
jgi:DNA-binding transcriptional LysR family regulator